MAELYIPRNETLEKVNSLLQGFWLEADSDNNPVLLLKLEASLTDSIIRGTPIELVIRNPSLHPRSCTLYVYDIAHNPFFVTGQQFSNEDPSFKGFDSICIKLANASKITVVFFNELSHPIFTTYLKLETNTFRFNQWLYNIYNNPNYNVLPPKVIDGNYFPETDSKGYKVVISNIDNSKTPKLTVIAPKYNLNPQDNNPIQMGSFTHSDFLVDGRHGYHQEISIENNLSRFFKPNIDFFSTPFNEDGTEFIDFIILIGNYTIILESKYVISEKQTKKHNAIVKAIKQLNMAEKAILDKNISLGDTKLGEKLKRVDTVIKYCILNDKTILTDSNTKGISKLYQKNELPIFISVSSFFQLLGALHLKNESFLKENLVYNSLNLYLEYLEGNNQILYIREFSMSELVIEQPKELP